MSDFLPNMSEVTGTIPATGFEGKPDEMPWWQITLGFVLRAITGIFIFAIIAGAAVLLDLAIIELETIRVDKVIVWGLRGAEYLTFTVDLLLFARFIIREAVRTWQKL